MSTSPCYHCNEPIPHGLVLSAEVLGDTRYFCCHGCEAVARAIVDNGLEDYYRFRTEPASKALNTDDAILDKLRLYDSEDLQHEFVVSEGTQKNIQLTIEGITCAACGWLIERQLARRPGIVQVAVNVSERRAWVSWDANVLSLSALLLALKNIGYVATPFQPDQHEAAYRRENKTFLKKVGLSGLMTMQVMMLLAGQYFDWFGNLEPHTLRYFHWIAFVLTTPVVFYAGSGFFLGAFNALRAGSVNMDVPISLAIAITYVAGVKATVTGVGEVYFESISMFIFLLLLSRYLEHRGRYQAAQLSANISHVMPVMARQYVAGGQRLDVLAKHLNVGDSVEVLAGERIPIDGEVTEGTGHVDEAMLTGEFMPVLKQQGSTVYAGTVSQDARLLIRVTRPLKQALLNEIVRLQTQAMASKPRIALLADRFSRYFVLTVLLISAFTYGYWVWQDNSLAWWITVSVLVATCPCALGLATPSALTCAMAALAREGILLKRADLLEQLTQANTLALDKTGTLTEGKFSIAQQWFLAGDNRTPSERMSDIAALESCSEHPIAKAFVSDALLSPPQQVSIVPGMGIEGVVNGQHYRIGNAQWMSQATSQCPLAYANVWVEVDSRIVAAFVLSDKIKSDAQASLEQLRDKQLLLLSGDHPERVKDIATSLGIADALGGQTPAEKLAHIRQLQHEGKAVVMLGDGINDSPVLAGADIAIAVSNATDIAKSAADVIMLRTGLAGLVTLFKVARETKRTIWQNMAWAIGYNLLVLPFAVSGSLTPWMAVVGMSLSSLIVVFNSTRLLRNTTT